MTYSIKSLIAATLLSVWATASLAETEIPKPRMMLVNTGMLCDTQIEVESLLTMIHQHDGAIPPGVEMPDTCGRFVPRSPVPMLVVPLTWYETPSANILIARFFHEPSGWVQFGWVAFRLNEDAGEPT